MAGGAAQTVVLPVPETRTVTLADGRTLAFVTCGASDGRPVLIFHGLPGSRMQRHPDDGIAQRAGVRVIHVDRPGFGLSSPQAGRALGDWPQDVQALADHLGFDRFAIAGISGGGPYAAACAALLGGRVTRTAIVSGVGPPGSMAGERMTALARVGFLLAPRAQWAVRALAAPAARLAVQTPARYLARFASHLSPPDQRILARPDVREMLAQDLREAFRQGVGALAEDLALLAKPWGLRWENVVCPVALWHGDADWLVPAAGTRALERAIPRAQASYLPGEGHFMIVDRWPEICAWLAAD